jgi:DNA-binding CsgD family transcriptional regulator
MPTSVRDAVLSRTVDLEPTDVEVLQLVATAPSRLDDRLLPALGVDLPTLRRLDSVGFLARERGGLCFRHELVRLAVESSVPPGGAPHLHARLLEAMEKVGLCEASVLTHHAVGARDHAAVVRYAREAAQEAVLAGSHAEAADFLATALDHLGTLDHLESAAASDRARLLLQLSFEQYMTSRLPEAIENVRATFSLWRLAGDAAGLARAYETCAIYEYYNAHRQQAEDYAERAAGIAQDAGARAEYGMARATRGFQAYMRNQLELASSYAVEAGQIARDTDEQAVALKTDMVHALVALSEGDTGARAVLTDHIESARDHGWDELASTGYSQLSSLDVEHRRYRAAELVLEESLPFTVERDIPICHHWQTSVRARLHFAEGHWNAAMEDADHVLQEAGMPLATVWPELVTGLVLLRRGDVDRHPAHLESAWALAGDIDEPLRRLPVLAALAERAWLTGRPDPRVTTDAVAELRRTASSAGTEWGRGELAAWLVRLGLSAGPWTRVAEPYRLLLSGDAEGAATWFHRAGDRFAEAMAWGDSPDPAHQARGVQLLDQLGAVATADRCRVALRRAGVSSVPPRPRTSTRANPAGLTNRQLEVAKFVARGFTNAEISSRLYISAKTTDHHVSAVLTKLGLPNRRAVMVQAEELGLA